MSRQLILAHDLGTSGNKACIFDINGEFLADGYDTYDTHYPQAGYAEHKPEDWWEAVRTSTKKVVEAAGVDPKDIKAISFSAHGMGVIPVDKNGKLIAERTMVWMDARATKEAEYIVEKSGARAHYEKTGNSFDLALYPAAKYLWLKRNQPEVYKKAFKFLGTKEYIIQKMTGQIKYTDYGEVGMSGLFNINEHDYDEELLALSEIDREKLLEPADCTTPMGELTKQAAEEMGLAEGTKVVLGSWDNYACAVGGGVLNKGTFVTCLGTAGWVGVNADKPLMSPDFMSNIVYVGDNTYFTSAHSHSACVAYEWVLDNMCSYLKEDDKIDYDKAEELASAVPIGSDKLFFMPSMFSGNTFYSDAQLTGSFVGLKMLHTNAHLIRSAMEGVGFDLMMGIDFFKQMNVMSDEARLIGGGANSDLWMQILSSMFDVEMVRPKNLQHIGALGAAAIAGVGAGLIKDFKVVDELIKSDDIKQPIKNEHESYEKLLPVFKKFYEQLIPAYREFGNLK